MIRALAKFPFFIFFMILSAASHCLVFRHYLYLSINLSLLPDGTQFSCESLQFLYRQGRKHFSGNPRL